MQALERVSQILTPPHEGFLVLVLSERSQVISARQQCSCVSTEDSEYILLRHT